MTKNNVALYLGSRLDETHRSIEKALKLIYDAQRTYTTGEGTWAEGVRDYDPDLIDEAIKILEES